jgi:MFS family permease
MQQQVHSLPEETPRGLRSRLTRLPMWAALTHRDFRIFWMGQSVSAVGDQFYFIALPWLVLQLTGSGLALGTVLIVAAVPRGALVLFGGVFADRYSPRAIMLVSNAFRSILVGLLAALVLTNFIQLWELYVLAFLFGTVDALFYPAFDTMPPRLLEEKNLAAGNGLVQISMQISGLIGPALAGIIIAVLGGRSGNGIAFALDAASFAVSAASLLLVRDVIAGAHAGEAMTTEAHTGARSMLVEVRAGLRYAWSDPVIRVLLGLALMAGVAISSPMDVGLATLAHSRFSAGAAAFGIMFTIFGVGSLIGMIGTGVFGIERRRGMMLIIIVTIVGSCVVGIGLFPNFPTVCVLLGVIGIAGGYVNVMVTTWLQTRTAQAMMGRVMSLMSLSSVGLAPLSLAASGILAQHSVSVLFVCAGGLMLLTGLGAGLSRSVRTL